MKRVFLPRPLRIFWIVNAALSLLCVGVMAVSRFGLNLGWPYNYPFLPFADWIDLRGYGARFELLHQAAFFTYAPGAGTLFVYPAPMAVLYASFYHLKWHMIAVFLVMMFGALWVWAGVLGRAMVRLGVAPAVAVFFLASAALLSYPLGFEFSLAQTEIFILLVSMAGVVTLLRGHTYLAALLFGIAASTKYYPAIYLGLFLPRREYKQFALGILTATGISALSLWYVGPTVAVAFRGAQAGAAYYRGQYIAKFLTETDYDHSLFAFVKCVVHKHVHDVMPSGWITAYLVCAVVAGSALYFLRIRRLPMLNQVLSLCVLSVLLPPTSHDYTLLQLYLPWGLLTLYALQRARAGRSVEDLVGAFVCFGMLFAAESEFIVHARTLSGQLKMVMLVVLLWIALTRRWEPVEGVGALEAV